jgi:hypothetical protein
MKSRGKVLLADRPAIGASGTGAYGRSTVRQPKRFSQLQRLEGLQQIAT